MSVYITCTNIPVPIHCKYKKYTKLYLVLTLTYVKLEPFVFV